MAKVKNTPSEVEGLPSHGYRAACCAEGHLWPLRTVKLGAFNLDDYFPPDPASYFVHRQKDRPRRFLCVNRALGYYSRARSSQGGLALS